MHSVLAQAASGALSFELRLGQSSVLTICILALLTFVLREIVLYFTRHSMPPGPFRWPLIGNALQLPQDHPWVKYTEWAKMYGPLMQLDVLGQHMLVITSAQTARDLMEKRSSIYSDRPHLVMAGDLAGFGDTLILQNYGEEFRYQRKLVSHSFSPSVIHRYYDLQEAAARRLVLAIIEDPDSLENSTRLHIASIILRMTYGYTVKGVDDPLFTTGIAVINGFSEATRPGAWPVDFVPILQYVPHWVPGFVFTRKAREWRGVLERAMWAPYHWCKENYARDAAHGLCLCGSILAAEGSQLSSDQEWLFVNAAVTVMGGGLDTNISTILSFVLAMLRFPEVQKKAQAEIDAVIGPNRLPLISDRHSLPYVRSVVTEVYRWIPAVPLGIPHALRQDDHYDGLFLSKGSVVVPNVWGMLHDPSIYPAPHEFKPERYGGLDAEMTKVTDIAFGFGRRACPGFYFAEGTIFAIVATVLAICDVVPTVDEHGQEVIPEVSLTSGAIVSPENVKCAFRPRSGRVKDILVEAVETEQE
uniref:Cytochrome P450 monooxygenase 45 n=1 Tax=Postia placenta (strain ATCC 44394 / Madison 698-R) TaxID=561896 RepID=CY045_POSPM|nr:RecName: Full=Cytochrome P450 monooxygenase 45 [Postia placenta Mad-698-R]BAK09396.1 cytochrome P450 [Postia placenta]BAK20189.1 cytochrome P450 [Postia placenta]